MVTKIKAKPHGETPSSEFQKFDDAMQKILSVSHDELKRREEAWKKRRKRKKRMGKGGGQKP